MASLTDFLFQGSPPPTVATYGTSTSSLPAWYNDFTQGLISRANAIAATPHELYRGARLADFQPAQNQAMQNVSNLAANYQPGFDQRGNIISGAYAPAAQATQGAISGNALGQYGGTPLNFFKQASAIDPREAAANSLQQAQQYNPFLAGAGNLGLAGMMTSSAGFTPASAGIGNYMNPYTQGVIGNLQNLAGQNLANANLNTANQFISGGSFGGSRMGAALGANTRAANTDLNNQIGQLLNSQYNTALGASQQDLARQLQSASQLGQLGQTQGALAAQTQQGLSNLGQLQGNLAQQQYQNLANLGQNLGTFGQADLARQLQGASQLGNLAAQQAQTGLQQNAALDASGRAQQQQKQASLDLAYQDFQNQLKHPYEQASFLNNIIRGLQIPTSTSTSGTGPASIYQPSPLGQIASLGTSLAGLGKLFG